jgi:hypothetical protein
MLGSTDGTHLVYSMSRPGRPAAYDAFVRTGSAAVKLNLSGTAYAGQLSGDTVPFQSVRRGDADIRFYSISTGSRSSAGTVVNSRNWEFGPSLSGRFLLFGRRTRGTSPETDRLLLYNAVSRQLRVIAEHRGEPDRDVFPGQVNGDYVVYTTCTPARATCRVTRYRISTRRRLTVPQPARRIGYGAGVTSAGVVYFVRGAWACGAGATIRSYDPATGTGRLLLRLGRGYDADQGFVFENGPADEFLYSRSRCSSKSGGWDVYKVVVT